MEAGVKSTRRRRFSAQAQAHALLRKCLRTAPGRLGPEQVQEARTAPWDTAPAAHVQAAPSATPCPSRRRGAPLDAAFPLPPPSPHAVASAPHPHLHGHRPHGHEDEGRGHPARRRPGCLLRTDASDTPAASTAPGASPDGPPRGALRAPTSHAAPHGAGDGVLPVRSAGMGSHGADRDTSAGCSSVVCEEVEKGKTPVGGQGCATEQVTRPPRGRPTEGARSCGVGVPPGVLTALLPAKGLASREHPQAGRRPGGRRHQQHPCVTHRTSHDLSLGAPRLAGPPRPFMA